MLEAQKSQQLDDSYPQAIRDAYEAYNQAKLEGDALKEAFVTESRSERGRNARDIAGHGRGPGQGGGLLGPWSFSENAFNAYVAEKRPDIGEKHKALGEAISKELSLSYGRVSPKEYLAMQSKFLALGVITDEALLVAMTSEAWEKTRDDSAQVGQIQGAVSEDAQRVQN